MRKSMVAVVVVLTGCGMPMGIDGGVELRELRVLTRQRVVTPRGVEVSALSSRVSWWEENVGKHQTDERDSEGAHVFRDVPAGPTLIQVSGSEFLFTALDRVETCVDSTRGGDLAGLQLDLTLSQAAGARDALRVSTSEGWRDQEILTPDAGSVIVQENLLSWRVRDLLVGQTTLTHHAREEAGTFSRTVAVGIFDAGVFSQTTSDIVTLAGEFTALPRGPEQSIPWDDASLAAIGTPGSLRYPVTFSAWRDGVRLASLEGGAGEVGPGPLALPNLAPDSYSVSGSWFVGETLNSRSFASFSWSAPWSSGPEMKRRFDPPTNVRFSSDGWFLSWDAPAVAPNFYFVVMENRGPLAPPVWMGTVTTDQTSIPLPPDLHVAGMTARVYAVTGNELSEVCTPRRARAATTAQIPSSLVQWRP